MFYYKVKSSTDNHFGAIAQLVEQRTENPCKEEYKGECYFLEAYYHFRVLQAFGPCPIIPEKVDPNVTSSDRKSVV